MPDEGKRKTPVSTFGEARLDASAPVSWAETAGTDPWVGTIQLDLEEAERVLIAFESSLYFETDDGRKIAAKKIYALGQAPASDPYHKAFVIADQRIWWRRKHVFRRYNIRTRTGDRRRLDADGEIPEEVAVVVDDVFYKAYSLQSDTVPWEAIDVLIDVLDIVVGEGNWVADNLNRFVDQRYVDSFEIDDSGDIALARALALVNGAAIKVREDGLVEVYSKVDTGAVGDLLETIENPVVGSSLPAPVRLIKSRPKSIRTLFSVEQEIRFDSLEPDDTITEDTRYCQNVVQVPDPTLDLVDSDGEKTRTVVQGTWITFEEAFAAWNADKGDADVPDIGHEEIREFWATSYIEAVWGEIGKLAPAIAWLKRVHAIRQHYRQTYRINRRWIQMIHSFRPYRVALLDFETGQFAESAVYADWTVIFNERGLFAQAEDLYQMRSYEGGVAAGTPLASGNQAPAKLVILDMEQGIVRTDFQLDLLGHLHTIIPSLVDEVATFSAAEWNEKTYFQDGTEGGEGQPAGFSLSSSHRVNFVVTVAPGSPNSNEQLWAEEVEVQDTKKYLASLIGLGDIFAEGPTWDLRIGGQVATARFAWNHGLSSEIEASMGVGGDGRGGDRSDLEELLQNPSEIRDLAEATAAGLYASMVDRYIGSKTVAMDPSIRLVGNISRVDHRLDPNGMDTTTVVIPEEVPPMDTMSLLPSSARRLFLREVQP